MISDKVLSALEYRKVLGKISEYAVLEASKIKIKNSFPEKDFYSVEIALHTTLEAYKLMYVHAAKGVDFFDEITDELDRSSKGATLSCAELLRVMRLLQSSRLTKRAVTAVSDEEIIYIRRMAESVFTEQYLEESIREKIISEDTVSDNASETLYQIRRKIKRLNEQIREKLSSFVRGSKMKYLQENIITMRGDRYVIPVKSEYKGQIRGLVHDQSSTGATVFIEPEAVLELNNDLKSAMIEESVEVEKILRDLSNSVGTISYQLTRNIDLLSDIDVAYAKSEYAYKTHSVMPGLNDRGYIDIKKGRHPLIDPEKVVPLDISLGEGYRFLLITGPNTGGKTVSLKLVGLFTLMAMTGIFLPAAEGTRISFFENIYADIGDEQSIEQSLSTFSSHMKNIVEITDFADSGSLVLLDEIGAGTDPDEGSALAQAVIARLVRAGSFGIITTHYSKLKEYAYSDKRIMNASMDFDNATFAPLYRVLIGMPGSSNAIEISRRLGLDPAIADEAYDLLEDSKISFENVIKEAEKSRQIAERTESEYHLLRNEAAEELDRLKNERAKFEAEKQRFLSGAKAESRRIVNEKLAEAEALIEELKNIIKKEEHDSGDVIKARTLRNKLENVKYSEEEEDDVPVSSKPVDIGALKEGDRVYVKTVDAVGTVLRVSAKKKEAEVMCGSVRINVKAENLFKTEERKKKKDGGASVSFVRRSPAERNVSSEINLIGQTADEAVLNLERFLDSCVVNGVEEIRIVHGKGLNILAGAVQGYLKKHPAVKEYRFGTYGEGEKGVTVARLK